MILDDESKLLEALTTVGPISVAIDAGHWSFQLYKSGIYQEPDCSKMGVDHAVSTFFKKISPNVIRISVCLYLTRN